ncbi:hypothetical protein F5888DRAFT_1740984, partial [Russula emetica]
MTPVHAPPPGQHLGVYSYEGGFDNSFSFLEAMQPSADYCDGYSMSQTLDLGATATQSRATSTSLLRVSHPLQRFCIGANTDQCDHDPNRHVTPTATSTVSQQCAALLNTHASSSPAAKPTWAFSTFLTWAIAGLQGPQRHHGVEKPQKGARMHTLGSVSAGLSCLVLSCCTTLQQNQH